ncbi:GD19281 [Drosophila simulans]|uniref:GD19281 n=1 Tax=Drosophila simulans TaxID=7240 RepID=B4QTF0_DROSI|nr:GD19281 [Drosophila simulans]
MVLILTPGHSLGTSSSSSSSDPVRSLPPIPARLRPLIASNKQFGAVLTKRQRHEKVEMERLLSKLTAASCLLAPLLLLPVNLKINTSVPLGREEQCWLGSESSANSGFIKQISLRVR